jgi:hypothetical protein
MVPKQQPGEILNYIGQRKPKMNNNIAVTGMSFDLMTTANNKWS